MNMPRLGDVVRVRATRPNIEQIPCSGRFLPTDRDMELTVTDHVVRRLLDGSLVLIPPPPPVAAPAEVD